MFLPAFLDTSLTTSRNFTDITKHYLQNTFFKDEVFDFKNIFLEGTDNIFIKNIYDKMLFEYTHKKTGYVEILKGYLIELLVSVLRVFDKKQIAENNNHLIQSAIEYIILHYNEKIPLSTLAQKAFLSQTQFCRRFKQYTGVTFSRFIQDIRVQMACQLLLTTDKNVKEIAYDVGYNDTKHFGSVFKKITGKNPARLRKD